MSTDFAILTRSCAESNETIKWEDGNEYPLIKMEFHLILILFILVKQNLSILLVELINLKLSIKALKNN